MARSSAISIGFEEANMVMSKGHMMKGAESQDPMVDPTELMVAKGAH